MIKHAVTKCTTVCKRNLRKKTNDIQARQGRDYSYWQFCVILQRIQIDNEPKLRIRVSQVSMIYLLCDTYIGLSVKYQAYKGLFRSIAESGIN